jgi:hypothetical protein
MLEKLVGKRVLVAMERDFGYEGGPVAIFHHPPRLWLSEAEGVVLRSTVVNPIPQVATREKKEELFLHLNSALRLNCILKWKDE